MARFHILAESQSAVWALVAAGSNLGDSSRLVQEAIACLSAFSDYPVVCSSLWKSAPVDCPPEAPDFINAAAAFQPRPDETPETLLEKLQQLERRFGRTPAKRRNESRFLDLDLIAFGACQCATVQLRLPHPRAHGRRFVLAPLSEVAPEFRLPGQSRTIRELLAQLPADGQGVERLEQDGGWNVRRADRAPGRPS